MWYVTIYGTDFHHLLHFYSHPSLWFLWVLYWITIVFKSIEFLASNEIRQNILWMSAGVLLTAMMLLCGIRLFGFQFVSYYYWFFLLGFMLHKYPLLMIRKYQTVIVAFFIWVILAWHWKMHDMDFSINFIPQSFLEYGYRGITGVIATILIFSMAPVLLNRSDKVISRIGQYTLGIFVCHLIIAKNVVSVLNRYIENITLLVIMSAALLTIISVAVVKIIDTNALTRKLLLGKNLK